MVSLAYFCCEGQKSVKEIGIALAVEWLVEIMLSTGCCSVFGFGLYDIPVIRNKTVLSHIFEDGAIWQKCSLKANMQE